MFRHVPKMFFSVAVAKIHRATVTETNINYPGSITIDPNLLEHSGIGPHFLVHVNGFREGRHWETYVIPGKRGEGQICLNGPPAKLFVPGEEVVIVAYAMIESSMINGVPGVHPVIVHVDHKNVITSVEEVDLAEMYKDVFGSLA